MTKTRWAFSLCGALILASATPALAWVPQAVDYQGVLRESDVPVTGTRKMRFIVYDAPTAGNTLYDTGEQTVQVSTGLFHYLLTPPATVNWGSIQPYVEVRVGATSASSILTPRDAIAGSIYALYASTAETVVAGSLTDTHISAGAAINAAKILGTAVVQSAASAQAITGGRLGVGEPSPTARLEVRPGSNDLYDLRVSSQNATPLLTVTNAGLVGLGTDSPTQKLHVAQGSIKLDNGYSIIFGDGSSMSSAGIGSAGALSNNSDAVVTANADSIGVDKVILRTGAVDRLIIPSDTGFVGINTPSPGAQLHVGAGDIRIDDTRSFTSNGAPLLQAPDANTTNLIARGASGIRFLNSALAPLAAITSAGNVGIGTTNPGAPLHVAGAAYVQAGLTASSGTFLATGSSQFSVQTSSGISVGGTGGVIAPFFSGTFYGSGAGLTGVPADNVAANNVTAGTLGSGVLLPAGNLTNGPVASSILPSTVAYTSVANTFTHGSGLAVTYGVYAGSAALSGGLTASSGTFTAAGSSQYSVQTSSGISVGGTGGVVAPFFSGTHYGDGSALTGVGAGNLANTDAAGQSAITAINSATAGTINWARLNKTGSNLTDIATRNHSDLSGIGTNTHAQIDTHIALTGTAHGATTNNNANAIVARDGSGNFSAGTITAALSGNANTATTAGSLSGNITAGQVNAGSFQSGTYTFPGALDFAGASVLNTSGYLGIGTSPGVPLDVIRGGAGDGSDIALFRIRDGNSRLVMQVSGGVNANGFLSGVATTLRVGTPGGGYAIQTTGPVLFGGGIGATLPSSAGTNAACFDTGTSQLSYAGTCTASDERLKRDVQTLPGGLSLIGRLRSVTFQWKDEKRGRGRQIGLIAQEVEKVLPEFVDTNDDGFKSVRYELMVSPLIAAVQELREEVEQLKADKAELKRLRAENERLKAAK